MSVLRYFLITVAITPLPPPLPPSDKRGQLACKKSLPLGPYNPANPVALEVSAVGKETV